MSKRVTWALAAFFGVVLVGLFIGWYGGADWTVRSAKNAEGLCLILYIAASAGGLTLMFPGWKYTR